MQCLNLSLCKLQNEKISIYYDCKKIKLKELCMDNIQLKIEKDSSTLKYIKIIREFDSSLSMAAIKQKIEENDYVVDLDLEYFDVLEDIQGLDRKKIFREMIEELYESGAKVSIFENEELISIEILDNWLVTLDEIKMSVESDMK